MATQRLGKWMLYVAWAIFLGLLTFAFQQWLARERNPNRAPTTVRDRESMSVSLKQNRQGHYYVSGSINDKPVEFIVDTGATDVSVPAELARALNLDRGMPEQLQTANGVVTGYATRLAQVRVGDIEQRDVRAHINPGMDGDEVLLGMSFLRRLEFTQRGDTLILRQWNR